MRWGSDHLRDERHKALTSSKTGLGDLVGVLWVSPQEANALLTHALMDFTKEDLQKETG